MSSGLAALLDDVAGIARLAAASLDDVAGAAGKASSKAAGVVIDDTAVTPRYVVGFTPDRELPIIAKIALGSLRNKLLFLLPAAILLSAFAPWAITPLLMLGGAYLCFEGAEKVIEIVMGHGPHGDDTIAEGDPAHLEKAKVGGAIRTDLILSAEIMAIALADVADKPLLTQAIVLAVVGILVTIGVYGVVALIVKMDDIGLHLAARDNRAVVLVGRGLVKAMPYLLSALAGIGTAAMIWVGGGILIHGLDHFDLSMIPDALHHTAGAAANAAPAGQGAVEWIVTAIGSGICGLTVGSLIVGLTHAIPRRRA
jgi:predicted DNA repair protein MutK